ncbi:hypothetical protein [Ruminococcus sp.]|uniref:hypothetical protein n=1 Tax=Ruminococcus sp. TaxID=41978 RepID=UPI003866BDF1
MTRLVCQASTTFDPVTNQFTVTWWINITADKMVNTQFAISYDKNVLSYDTTDGVNQVYDEDDPTTFPIISFSALQRATEPSSTPSPNPCRTAVSAATPPV